MYYECPKYKMKKIICFLILILLNSFCFALVENKKINLKQAIDITLQANPRVQIEKLNVETSKNEIEIADRLQNPSLHTFQNIGTAGEGNPQQVGADYTIEILKRGKRKEYSKSESFAAYDNQKFKEQQLILNVKKTYIDLLLKKSNLKILTEQEDLARELLNSATQGLNKGKLPKTEVIQAKIALNRAIMYTNIAKSEVIFAQNRLNSTMNTSEINYDTKEDSLSDDYAALDTISPTDDDYDFEKIKQYALSQRYDLLKASQEVESAKLNLKVVKSQLIPDLELIGGYAYQSKGVSQTGTFLSGAYAGASLVNIPLFYRYKPEIKNAELEIQKAKLRYEDIKVDVIRDLTDAWEKFVIARNNLNYYNKELLSNSRELLEESKESLEKKDIDITSFLVSKKLYLEVMLGYEAALAEYYSCFAELLKEMNAESLDVIKYDKV